MGRLCGLSRAFGLMFDVKEVLLDWRLIGCGTVEYQINRIPVDRQSDTVRLCILLPVVL